MVNVLKCNSHIFYSEVSLGDPFSRLLNRGQASGRRTIVFAERYAVALSPWGQELHISVKIHQRTIGNSIIHSLIFLFNGLSGFHP